MLFSFENIYRQYLLCRKNKRNTVNALRFEVNQEKELVRLQEELIGHTYRPGRSVCFFSEKPKLREIFAADFRDRIVHHILVDYLESIWEPVFIHDSYACRKGKGIHRGVAALSKFIRRVTHNTCRRAWYLQLDIENYFMSLDKGILFSLIKRRCPDRDALWLSEVLVFHDCTVKPIVRGDARLAARLPPHKTLFQAVSGKGLPIGNLNSQFFANVYLNSLDQFVKHQLKCRWYVRYCDDFVLLAENRERLESWEKAIAAYLADELALLLNKKARRLLPVSNGVNFLGYIVRAEYLLVRRRVIANLLAKLAVFEKRLVSMEGIYRIYHFDRQTLDNLHATFTSYLGHFKHAGTFKPVGSIWRRFAFLSRYFDLDRGNLQIRRKYLVPGVLPTVRSQYGYLQKLYPETVDFFQVGRNFEFYQHHSNKIAGLFQLTPLKKNRRQARYGFPTHRMNHYLQLAIGKGIDVVIVREGNYLARIKERTVWRRYERWETNETI